MSSGKPSFAEEAYSETASLGRLTANIGAYIATFIGSIMIIVGLVLLLKKKPKLDKVMGTVKKINFSIYDTQNKIYNYDLLIDYTVDNKIYERQLSKSSATIINLGDTIEVYYDPSDPNKSELVLFPYSLVGWILIILGIFIIGGSWLWVYITNKSKLAAALGGTEVVVGGIKSAITN